MILLTVLLLLVSAYMVWLYKGDDIIESQVLRQIEALELPIDSISVDYPNKSMTLYNIDFLPLIFGDKSQKIVDKYDVSGTALQIHITGINWFKIRTNAKLEAKKILVEGVESNMLLPLDKYLVNGVSEHLKSLSTDTLIVKLNEVNVYDSDKTKDNVFTKFTKGYVFCKNVNAREGTELSLDDFSLEELQLEDVESKSTNYDVRVSKLDLANNNAELSSVFFDFYNSPTCSARASSIYVEDIDIEELKKKDFVAKKVKANFESIIGDQRMVESNVLQQWGGQKIDVSEIQLTCKTTELRYSGRKQVAMKMSNLDFTTTGLLIEKATDKFTLGTYVLSGSNIYRFSKNNMQTATCRSVLLKNDKSRLEGVSLKPVLSRAQFAKNTQFIRNQYDVEIPVIELSEDLLKQVIVDKSISIDNITVQNMKTIIYSDWTTPESKNYIPLISEYLIAIPYPIYIGEVDISSSYFKFELLAERRNDTGNIFMEGIKGRVSNITNQSVRIAQNPITSLYVESQFMGYASMSVDLKMDLRGPNFPYEYTGTLAAVEFDEINRMLEDLTATIIQKGEMDRMKFVVKADKYNSTGTMDFLYSNMKLMQVIERETGITDPFKLIINGVILRRNNRADRHPRQGKIKTKRTQNKGMFMQIWEAIFNGIQSILAPRTPFNRN